MKVLYIYAGERVNTPQGVMGEDYPDNQFYGQNHLREFGIEAEHKEFKDVPLVGKLGMLPFGVKHALTTFYFSLFGDYDVIFGPSLIYGLFLNRLFSLRQKTVLLDISLGRMLRVNDKRVWRKRLIKFALCKVGHVVSLSNYQRDLLVEKIPLLQAKSSVVRFGIDVGFYKPKYEGRREFILSAGRDNGRDYGTVYRTAELIPEKKFVIVCEPRNVKNLGKPPKNVEVIYDLPHKDLCSKLLEAKALLLTTYGDDHVEGSDCSGQTVLLEAMASGTPIVVTRKKYLEEYIDEEVEAVVVEPENPSQVKDALRGMSEDTGAAIARAARARAEREFTSTKFALGLSRIFLKLA